MSLDDIFINLTQNMLNVYEWLVYNSMKANPDQLQFMILGNTESHTLQIGDITTKPSDLLDYLVLLLIPN